MTINDAPSQPQTVLLSLQELVNLFDKRKPEKARDGVCWLCQESSTIMEPYDKKLYCVRCCASLLRAVILPGVDGTSHFSTIESNMVAAIDRVEQDEKRGDARIPINKNVADPDPPQWECYRCNTTHPRTTKRCPACKVDKPIPSACSECYRDYIKAPICMKTKQRHTLWRCSNCKGETIDHLTQCRICRADRQWTCPRCSLNNTYTNLVCKACEHEGTLNSFGSMICSTRLRDMGLSVNEARRERQQSKEVEEHQQRLEMRLEQMELSPIPIADDGNCLFRALSYQLLRTDALHASIRLLCTEYLRVYKSEFMHFAATDNFEKYVADMAKDKAWGDELTVTAASRALSSSIHVITSETDRWHVKYYAAGGRHLTLCYIAPLHYYCAKLQNKEAPTPIISVESRLKEASDRQHRDRQEAEYQAQYQEATVNSSPAKTVYGPPTKPLPPPGTKTAIPERMAKFPEYRVTLHDFGRFLGNPPMVVRVHLGDSSSCFSDSERREVTSSSKGLYFYLYTISYKTVTDSVTESFFEAQRIVAWEKPVPLFLLQRVDTGSFVTPSTQTEEKHFGSLQRKLVIAPLMMNTLTKDFSNALMTATSSQAGTLFQLRFLCEKLPARHVCFLQEKVYTAEQYDGKSSFMLRMPFNKVPKRYCVKCYTWYMEGMSPSASQQQQQCAHASHVISERLV